MRRFVMFFTLVACAALVPVSVAGQYPLALRGGIFLPVDNTLKDKTTQWLALGLDVHLAAGVLQDSETVVSVDYMTHSLGGTKGTLWPITVNQFFYAPVGFGRMYWGIGAGATIADVREASKTVFGLKATVGIELDLEWFLEGSYFWSDVFDKTTSARVNGVAFYLGYRF